MLWPVPVNTWKPSPGWNQIWQLYKILYEVAGTGELHPTVSGSLGFQVGTVPLTDATDGRCRIRGRIRSRQPPTLGSRLTTVHCQKLSVNGGVLKKNHTATSLYSYRATSPRATSLQHQLCQSCDLTRSISFPKLLRCVWRSKYNSNEILIVTSSKALVSSSDALVTTSKAPVTTSVALVTKRIPPNIGGSNGARTPAPRPQSPSDSSKVLSLWPSPHHVLLSFSLEQALV